MVVIGVVAWSRVISQGAMVSVVPSSYWTGIQRSRIRLVMAFHLPP